ncbi:MAG: hypothetical protein MKZ84_06020 [Dehalococcoidia bacterium]|nr:hypothetical protein [Dehalococcoidia bacterium]
MRLYEYEGKRLLQSESLSVPAGIVTTDVNDAVEFQKMHSRLVVKAQVLSGNRMKAGVINFASTSESVINATKEIFSKELKNFEIHSVLVEEEIEFTQELFLGITWDLPARLPVALVSLHGGIDIEDVGKDSVVRKYLSTIDEDQEKNFTELLQEIGFIDDDLVRLVGIFSVLWRLFKKMHANLIEVNPLVRAKDGRWVVLDVHMELDDDAMYFFEEHLRKVDIEPVLRPTRKPSRLEIQATNIDQSDHRGVAGRVIEFDGELGLLIGGGGASLTIFDSVRAHGGRPANYCEIGGNPSVSKVAELTALLLNKPTIEKIAVIMNVVNNTRADLIARGVIAGCLKAGCVPSETVVVFRVPGSWEEESFQLLKHYGIEPSDRNESLDEAAKRAVNAVK